MAEEEPESAALLPAPGTEETSAGALLLALGKICFALLCLAAVVVGAVHSGQCPRQPLLPAYLIALGAAALVLLLLGCLPCGDGTGRPSAWTRGAQAACLLFLFAWFVAGNVWVYSIYPPDYEAPGKASFCQRTLFLFAFGITTAVHAAFGVALLLASCILLGVILLKATLPYCGHGDRGGP